MCKGLNSYCRLDVWQDVGGEIESGYGLIQPAHLTNVDLSDVIGVKVGCKTMAVGQVSGGSSKVVVRDFKDLNKLQMCMYFVILRTAGKGPL